MRKLHIAAAVICLFVCVLTCVGCSSTTYNLTKDEAIETKWGAFAQFKVADDWKRGTSTGGSNSSSIMEFTPADGGPGDGILTIKLNNTNLPSYSWGSSVTYKGWIDYREAVSDIHDKPLEGETVEDYSMEQIGTFSVGDTELRLYKESYNVNYSDKAYEAEKADNPNVEQKTFFEEYHAVLKDGKHDIEISAVDEGLLREFLKTLEVNWG